MKKILILICILISVSSFISPEKAIEIEESFRSARLYVDQNRLYLNIIDTNVIIVYSRRDLSRLFQFGKKGEGPGEFTWIRSISSSQKDICVFCPGKIVYFSLDGKFLREQKISSELNIKRLGNSFVRDKFIHDKKGRELLIQYIVCDSKLKPIKMICEHKLEKNSFVFGRGSKKRDYNLAGSRPHYKISEDKIIVGDPRNGMHFTIYDEYGKKVNEFTHEHKKEKVTPKDKDFMMKKLKKTLGRRWERYSKSFNFVCSEYFPPFRYFRVADEKIFAILYQEENNRARMQVYDFKGNLIKKGSIISGYSGVICDNYYYYLKENEDTEMWEIHREKLL